MNRMHEVQNISVAIGRPVSIVYDFVRDGRNLSRWATGLGNTVHPEGDAWIADGPLGRITLRFAVHNELGVLDHDVTLPSGEVIHNPMRVVPDGDGSAVTFTLLRLSGVSDEKFREDARWVQRDLDRLKELLEERP